MVYVCLWHFPADSENEEPWIKCFSLLHTVHYSACELVRANCLLWTLTTQWGLDHISLTLNQEQQLLEGEAYTK